MPTTDSKVDFEHPAYDRSKMLWKKCRDAIGGEELVKAARDAYLPKLDGMDDSEYRGYATRAHFYGASGRTVKGLAGLIMRKEAVVSGLPDSAVKSLEEFGVDGERLSVVALTALNEVLTTSRVGMLVDSDSEGQRVYVSLYTAESIINWRTIEIDGIRKPVLVVLHESVEVPDWQDPFVVKIENRYRVLSLEAANPKSGADPVVRYVQRVWRKLKADDGRKKEMWEQVGDDVYPVKHGGGAWEEIPFKLANDQDVSWDVHKPPLLDLVNTNLSHYRNSADLEHGLHYTALPTPYALGFDIESGDLKIGPSEAWVSKRDTAKVGLIEFTGAGLGSLRETMRDKESQMAKLGSKMLEQQQRTVEATETVKMRQAGEHSSLAATANAVAELLTFAVSWWAQYKGVQTTNDLKVELNTDYGVAGLEPSKLTAIMNAYLQETMSFETMFYLLHKNETYPDGWTVEQELASIAQRSAVPATTPTTNTNPEEEDDEQEDPEND